MAGFRQERGCMRVEGVHDQVHRLWRVGGAPSAVNVCCGHHHEALLHHREFGGALALQTPAKRRTLQFACRSTLSRIRVPGPSRGFRTHPPVHEAVARARYTRIRPSPARRATVQKGPNLGRERVVVSIDEDQDLGQRSQQISDSTCAGCARLPKRTRVWERRARNNVCGRMRTEARKVTV